MPYIDPEQRTKINKYIEDLVSTPGTLNYAITKLCHDYIKNFGLCYDTINTVIGVLECTKQELYRVVAVTYEDKKKIENGPVSELDR